MYEYKKEWRKEYINVMKHCDLHDVDYYLEECPVCVSIRNKIYRSEHEEEIREYNKIYSRENKEKKNEYYKTRRENDPEYNIRRIVSNSIYNMIKSQTSNKNGKSIITYLSYTIFELKEHLENQFESWMTWDNHGKYNANVWDDNNPLTWTWQIDHIIPQSDIPYTSMEDENFKICWSLENLRPLSAKQNILDGVNKIRHK